MNIKAKLNLLMAIIAIPFIAFVTWMFGVAGFIISAFISIIIIAIISSFMGTSFSILRHTRKGNSIYSKAVGVTFKNDDYSDRQNIIKSDCVAGDELELSPYLYNGAPAVKLLSHAGNQIGNIKADLAKDIYNDVLNGTVKCVITEVTGGTPGNPTNGVNIILLFQEDEIKKDKPLVKDKVITKEDPILEKPDYTEVEINEVLKERKLISVYLPVIVLILGIACLLLAAAWYFN